MPKLTVIPTPIGNLKDITLRCIEKLQEADFLLVEDTRVSIKLLKHLSIEKQMIPYHKFNEHKKLPELIQKIEGANEVGLLSDAGTPSISDPGFLIVRECLRQGIQVDCLPGPVAFIPALVNSGLPSDRFCFEGFLPQKKGRQKRLDSLKEETRTLIFYESPYRLVKSLTQFAEIFGQDRRATVSKEISKLYEKTFYGTLKELADQLKDMTIKGEYVIVVAGVEN